MDPKTERRPWTPEDMEKAWQGSQRKIESGYKDNEKRYDQPEESQ